VDADAVQALEAVVVADFAAAVDGIVFAAMTAGLAGLAAFGAARQPVERRSLPPSTMAPPSGHTKRQKNL
jgi:hypothetical protein